MKNYVVTAIIEVAAVSEAEAEEIVFNLEDTQGCSIYIDIKEVKEIG